MKYRTCCGNLWLLWSMTPLVIIQSFVIGYLLGILYCQIKNEIHYCAFKSLITRVLPNVCKNVAPLCFRSSPEQTRVWRFKNKCSIVEECLAISGPVHQISSIILSVLFDICSNLITRNQINTATFHPTTLMSSCLLIWFVSFYYNL